MNLYRVLAYLLTLVVVVLAAAAVELGMATPSADVTAEQISHALTVLAIVIAFTLLVIIILLCLARAKDRLQGRRSKYREIDGRPGDDERHPTGLENICDVLVRRKLPRKCVELPIPVTRRPDPCIYSQFFLMDNGQPVTWDNPNIKIRLGGIEQDTYNLQRATRYDVTVGIENASPFFDSLGTQIQVNLLDFGIGQPHAGPIHSYVIDVPAGTYFPGVGTTFPWTTPPDKGHYCIQVLIQHPDDVNTGNNEGWNNTEIRGVSAGEPMTKIIPIRNALPFDRKRRADEALLRHLSQVEVMLDSYVLPDGDLLGADPDVLFAPKDPVWNATVNPEGLHLAPGQASELELRVTVPEDTAQGTRAVFNVGARAGGRPIGGVTITLEVG